MGLVGLVITGGSAELNSHEEEEDMSCRSGIRWLSCTAQMCRCSAFQDLNANMVKKR